MKLEDMKCLSWLQEALDALTEEDLKAQEPIVEFDPNKGECLLGRIENDEIKYLWCLYFRWQKELMNLVQKHLAEHILGVHAEEDCDRFTNKIIVLQEKTDIVHNLLTCSIRFTMNIEELEYGIRKGWKIVSLPNEKKPMDPRSLGSSPLAGLLGSLAGGSVRFPSGYRPFTSGSGPFSDGWE